MASIATAPSSSPTPFAAPANSLGNSPRLARLKAAPRKPGEASFFFYDAHFKNEAVKILPGEYFVYAEDILIMTTLGSCIAACLWDRDAKVGGMNHFMLPQGEGDAGSGRYGSYAMELLINELLKRGAARHSLEAKVFGGGQVISGMNTMNVGERNTKRRIHGGVGMVRGVDVQCQRKPGDREIAADREPIDRDVRR